MKHIFTISSSAIGGITPYTYLWSNGATGQNIDSLGLGVYSLTVVDSIYCSVEAEYEFPYLWLNLDTNIIGQGCDGIYNNPSVYLQNGEIHVSATGGTSPYDYTWNNGFPVTDFYAQTDSSIYSLTVTDASGCYASATIVVGSDQEIYLPEGWSYYSTSIIPYEEPTISESFTNQGLKSEVTIVKDYFGPVWWPAFDLGYNNYFTPGQGYHIKMASEQSYYLKGSLMCPEDTSIELIAGWNIPGYLRTTASPIATEFSSFYQDIIKVKDELGLIYWPEWFCYMFTHLEPGEAYQLQDSSAQSFYYSPNSYTSGTKNLNWNPNPTYSYFNDKSDLSTGAFMLIMLPFDFWEEVPEEGSEIGVLGEMGQLVGRAIYEGAHTPVIVYGDDITTLQEEGLAEDESFSIVVWEPGSKALKSVKVDYWAKGNNQYAEGKVSIAGSPYAIAEQLYNGKVLLFPNPSTGNISLRVELLSPQNLTMEIFSLEGKNVLSAKYPNQAQGIHNFQFDLGTINSGTYTLRMLMEGEVKYIKFVIIR